MERNGQIWVTSQYMKSGRQVGEEITKEDMILVDKFETEPAEVEAKLGMTVNLGNYESLRVDVGVKIPCYKEEIANAHILAFQIVEKELFNKVKEVKGAL